MGILGHQQTPWRVSQKQSVRDRGDPITLVGRTAHLLNDLCLWPAEHGQCFKLIFFVFCDSTDTLRM